MDSTSRSSSSGSQRHKEHKEHKESRDYKDDRDRDRDRDRKHHRRHDDDEDEDRHRKHKSSSSSSKSRHRDGDDREDRHRHKHHKSSSSRRSDRDNDKRSHRDNEKDVDMASIDDEDMWVEKEVPETVVSAPSVSAQPSSSSSTAQDRSERKESEEAQEIEGPQQPKRDSWMTDSGGMDFGLMGALKVKKPKEEKPDPEKLQVSSRELNVHLKAGLHVDQYPVQEKPSYTIGDAGSQWRMTKLKRVMETAAEERVPPEVIGLERYGSIEKYQEALAERKELDRRMSKRNDRRGDRRDDRRDDRKDRESQLRGSDRRRDSNDSDSDRRPSSRTGRLSQFSSAASSPFQRPMDEQERLEKELARRKIEKEREGEQEKRYTPIPSPFATQVSSPMPNHSAPDMTVLTQDQLNKLKAKALRAKMLDLPDAADLEKEYESAKKTAEDAASRPAASAESNRVVVVQTMGRSSGSSSPAPLGPGNSKHAKKKEVTHDAQGNRVGYQGEEDSVDLQELVRREKMGLDESMDKEFARRVTRDAAFRDDNDYMDDNADKIARTVKKTDVQMKSSAIHDYKKTQSALDNCPMCYKDDGRTLPTMAVVSLGTRVYLGLPLTKEFLPGHCMIVPIQHVTSTLECDDDAWEEIRNFMKCLIQMHAAQDRAVIFSETVINLKWHKHSVIECIPIPWEAGRAAPGYFKEAILNADEEWSQHKKLIETDAKLAGNGGFRRRLTSKMPFFHVWLGSPDKGYGHVIEDADRFQDYFVKEVLASICEMDPSQWQRKGARRIPISENPSRVEAFKKSWKAWDWTRAIEDKK
ncbi:hypothetical protein CPB97_012178 [Podila verticillata]|nr:hypothetical protein CPB97_012178 [Podila verticillata]